MGDKGQDKRRRMVEAATVLFNRYGFKRTSVDLLAAEAGVAKPTIYAYFADKEAIFRAVVEQVCEELLEAAQEARDASAPVADRITRMLVAKFTRYFELVHSSPHARELIDSHGRIGADIVQKADRAFVEMLTRAIEQAAELDPERISLSAGGAAAMLIRAASGAAYDATSVQAHKKHLGEIVRALVRAMTA